MQVVLAGGDAVSVDTLVGGGLDVELDSDLEELLVEDVPCQGLSCPFAARWAYRCSSCSFDHHFCDLHRMHVDSHLARGEDVTCCGHDDPRPSTCGALLPSPCPWRPL